MNNATVDIGIIVVSYNVRFFLNQCLTSINNSELNGLNIAIWVVDNNSIDGSALFVKNHYPSVNLIENVDNVGFSKANNQAIVALNAKYILLLNPDTVLQEDTLFKCYEFMEGHQDAGALGVKMIDGSGKYLPESKRGLPTLWNSFCKLSYLSDLFPQSKWFSGYYLGHLDPNQTQQIEVLCGAFMFIRNETIKRVGLLDEAFFMYGEDIDYSFRIIKEGYNIYYSPLSTIIHYKGESTKKGTLKYVKTFYGAMQIYVDKHSVEHGGKWFKYALNFAITFRAAVSGAMRLIKELFYPLLDMLIIWLLLNILKNWWAIFYFGDGSYYAQNIIQPYLILYSLFWVFGLWLNGHYHEEKKISKHLYTFAITTIIMLAIYALLPEKLRSSRAILLMGSMVGFVVTYGSGYLRRYVSNKKVSTNKRIAVISNKNKSEHFKNLLLNLNIPEDHIYFINPTQDESDSFYTNHIGLIENIVHTLQINEIIFDSESISMKDIINTMIKVGPHIFYKIASEDSLSIIGSKSRNDSGELYTLDINYALKSIGNRRLKRINDLLISIGILMFLPFVFALVGLKPKLFMNIIDVFSGKKTWVGYGGYISDYDFLPKIPKSVIGYPYLSQFLPYSSDFFQRQNIEYAKNFSLTMDFIYVVQNVHRLANG